MQVTFKLLLSRALKGDTGAKDQLYVMAWDHLTRTNKVGDNHPLKTVFSQSDAAQEALVLVLRKLNTFEGSTESEWYKWLDTIVGNVVKDQNRMAHTQKRDVKRLEPILGPLRSDQSSPSRVVARADAFDWVQKHVDQLPVEQRRAMRMRYLEDASIAEIASKLSKTEDAVAGLLRRGLASTRERTRHQQADHR